MTAAKRRTRPSRRKRRPGSRLRWRRLLLGVGLPVAVLAALLLLHVYVQLTGRFEGRLWALPSRVYSGDLVLTPGAGLGVESLVGRLRQAGYVEGSPDRPGIYRTSGRLVEVHLRGFEGPDGPLEPRRRTVRFSRDRVVALRDEEGARLQRVIVEPLLLATLYGDQQEERELIRLDEVPKRLLDAVLAAEDARFYRHHGVDLRSIGRAALANLRQGRIVQGGSTITQQTVKNLYLGQQRTWWRKLRELVMASMLDARYSKDRILEVYLNEVYLGQRGPVAVCGVSAAARFYFGRDLDDLSVGESALLAGMIRSPGSYNPWSAGERAVERRNQVLQAMLRLELIDTDTAEAARAEPLSVRRGDVSAPRAPYVIDLVRAQLAEQYPSVTLSTTGLRIFTSIDPLVQAAATAALRGGLERLERDMPAVRRQKDQRTLQGAVVVTRPWTGEVLALVGGRDYGQTQFNRAVQATRQPGSCFKPFVYLAAFEAAVRGDDEGLLPATILADEPLVVKAGGTPWHPSNYDGEFRGPVSARRSLQESLNVPTVRTAIRVGLREVASAAERSGFERGFRPLPSLALGAQEVTPLELASAYGTVANLGRRAAPRIIRAVTDADGGTMERRLPDVRRVFDPRAAYLVSDVLEGVMTDGTGRSAAAWGFRGIAAGKTGTSDDTRDAWFVGYNTELLALVWVGYDDNTPTGLTGASGALPVWVDFMKRVGQNGRFRWFREPEGLVRLVVDPQSGLPAARGCPQRTRELFPAEAAPDDRCPLHRRGFFRRLRDRFRRSDDPAL